MVFWLATQKKKTYDMSNVDWFKNIASSVCKDTKFTTQICVPPIPQEMSFTFSTTYDLKVLALEGLEDVYRTAVYTKNRLSNEELVCISDSSSDLPYNRVVLLDIHLDVLKNVLCRVPKIVIVYSKEDFPKLWEVSETIEEWGLLVPEYIQKIAKKYSPPDST